MDHSVGTLSTATTNSLGRGTTASKELRNHKAHGHSHIKSRAIAVMSSLHQTGRHSQITSKKLTTQGGLAANLAVQDDAAIWLSDDHRLAFPSGVKLQNCQDLVLLIPWLIASLP